MPATSADPRTHRLVQAYTGLTRESLPALLSLYHAQASFKDPFNDVLGRPAIERIFSQMFEELHEPRFVVQTAATEGNEAFLGWEMHFRRQARGAPMTIRGASHLRYSSAGLVFVHRDYWDAAEELYAKLPVLGLLMRALQRRLSTPQP
ncbi:ketosteroid isomerase-like protein [Pelomonas saccharophila]|uniref:Ketosteroid isomerase-like protein n=1 Tax=Roseateles saccharophilus TaxID=304 RepID=A0ABU1YP17_ROSSA|nr:nuclear transport factor 2 family protein [Roseateles saccharophilus]MDR7269726.1 ketosteroid isomerase-like protein [Roseateles saccharophilus]